MAGCAVGLRQKQAEWLWDPPAPVERAEAERPCPRGIIASGREEQCGLRAVLVPSWCGSSSSSMVSHQSDLWVLFGEYCHLPLTMQTLEVL